MIGSYDKYGGTASGYIEMERMMRELDYRNEERMHRLMKQFQYQMMPMGQLINNPYTYQDNSTVVKEKNDKKDKLKSLVAYYYHKRK